MTMRDEIMALSIEALEAVLKDTIDGRTTDYAGIAALVKSLLECSEKIAKGEV